MRRHVRLVVLHVQTRLPHHQHRLLLPLYVHAVSLFTPDIAKSQAQFTPDSVSSLKPSSHRTHCAVRGPVHTEYTVESQTQFTQGLSVQSSSHRTQYGIPGPVHAGHNVELSSFLPSSHRMQCPRPSSHMGRNVESQTQLTQVDMQMCNKLVFRRPLTAIRVLHFKQ